MVARIVTPKIINFGVPKWWDAEKCKIRRFHRRKRWKWVIYLQIPFKQYICPKYTIYLQIPFKHCFEVLILGIPKGGPFAMSKIPLLEDPFPVRAHKIGAFLETHHFPVRAHKIHDFHHFWRPKCRISCFWGLRFWARLFWGHIFRAHKIIHTIFVHRRIITYIVVVIHYFMNIVCNGENRKNSGFTRIHDAYRVSIISPITQLFHNRGRSSWLSIISWISVKTRKYAVSRISRRTPDFMDIVKNRKNKKIRCFPGYAAETRFHHEMRNTEKTLFWSTHGINTVFTMKWGPQTKHPLRPITRANSSFRRYLQHPSEQEKTVFLMVMPN